MEVLAGARELREKWDQVYRKWPTLFGDDPSSRLGKLVDLRAAGTALVWGCGTGRNVRFLLRHGWEVDAVENSTVALDRVPEGLEGNDTERLTLALPEEFVARQSKYDLVVSVGVLHGYPESEAVRLFQELVNQLGGDALLFCSFFCGCTVSPTTSHFRTFCGGEEFDVFPLDPDALYKVLKSTHQVSILRHGIESEDHGEEEEHQHHVIHLSVSN